MILTHSTVLGDIVIYEGPIEYTRESVAVTNPEANENTFGFGYPLNGGTPVLTGALANMTGILLERWVAPASATKKCAVLRRGPAVINRSRLPTEDYNGGAFNMSTFQTELEAFNPPVVVRTEPTVQTETEI